ncbi:MAG: hypothetical protein N2645_10015 [Clostridia bacterium]|nr:hypothetical protein [Clostridia bacterium]
MSEYFYVPPYGDNYKRQPTGYPTGMQSTGSQPTSAQQPIMPLYPLAPIGTTLPTGLPLGPTTGGATPSPFGTTATPPGEVSVTTVEGVAYMQGFLRTQIGKRVRVEFLIGNMLTDRLGTLMGVGASYILIRPEDSDDLLVADLYSIKFVTVYM